jgi:hypothetical protein
MNWQPRRELEATPSQHFPILSNYLAIRDEKGVDVVLGNRLVLRIARKEIVMNEENMRWECEATKARGYQVCE